MNIELNEPFLFSPETSRTSEEYAEVLARSFFNVYGPSDEDFNKLELDFFDAMHGLAVVSGMDKEKMCNAIVEQYAKLLPMALDYCFSRLENMSNDPDTYTSVYISNNDVILYLWGYEDTVDDDNTRFSEVFLPVEYINDLRENYVSKHEESRVIGQYIAPMDAVLFYNKHRDEIVKLNIEVYSKETILSFDDEFFNVVIDFFKENLTNKEIVQKLEEMYSNKEGPYAVAPAPKMY